MMTARTDVVFVSFISSNTIFKKYGSLYVPGQDVINIVYSPVFCLFVCFFIRKVSTVASDSLDSV